MAVSRESWTRVMWVVLGLACAVLLLSVVYWFVGTFVFGVFIYYAVRPIYRQLRQAVTSPTLAAFLSMFLLVLPALVVVVATLSVAVQELARFLQRRQLNGIQARLAPYVDAVVTDVDLDALLSGSTDTAPILDSLTVASQSVSFVGIGALHLFVMLALAFYLLRDGSRLAALCHRCVPDPTFEAYARAVDRDLKSVYFGNIANAVFTGTIGAVTYTLLNQFAPGGFSIPYPALLGLLAGIASLVPVVGMKLVYVPVATYFAGLAVVADQTGALWFVAAFVLLSLVVVDTIPDIVLRPYVSRGTLHSGTLMLTYIFGSLLFGWYGIFLGPLLLVVVVEFVRVVLPVLYDSWGERTDVDQTTLVEPDWTKIRGETGLESVEGGYETK